MLILLVLATIGLTFAYWDELADDSNGTIEVGVGTQIIIEEDLSTEANLIPIGAIKGSNETDQILKEYNVVLSKKFNKPLYLVVEVEKVLIGDKEIFGLVNMDLEYNPYILNEVKVLLSITMNNLDMDYKDIYNQKITYSLKFSVEEID
jgi:hypothetical protein